VANALLYFTVVEAELDGTSRVDVDGRSYEVLGPPAIVQGAFGPDHIEADLRYLKGE
jgi:hypothetical protein